jgi:hypothetical protein
MDPMDCHRLRGNRKALSAALGVGVLITMGAVSLAHPTKEDGAPINSWQADTNVTLVPATRVQPSFAPKLIADPCTWAAPHARAHGVC